MRQYLEIKAGHEDAILFFRLGDFYEMFFDDAERAASILDITLTTRNRNDPNPIPLCGIPYHSARPYIARLLEAGVKVAVCEQVELPGASPGPVKREVRRVISPGTNLDEDSLGADSSNFLAAVYGKASAWGLAWMDFSTGELETTRGSGLEPLRDSLFAVGPSEILIEDDSVMDTSGLGVEGCMITEVVAVPGVASGTGELPEDSAAATAMLLAYADHSQAGHTGHLRPARYSDPTAGVALDVATRRNLELTRSREGGGRAGTLLEVIDGSVTAMGRRLTARWLEQPLGNLADIGHRLDGVELFVEDYALRDLLRETLKGLGDLERLCGRLGSRTAGPRDLLRVAASLEVVAKVASLLGDRELPGALADVLPGMDSHSGTVALLRRALSDEVAAAANSGGFIRDGYNDEVDRLRAVSRDGKGWIAAFEKSERESTGINGLKVGYNRVFGYYLEVSRSNQDRVPDNYERKQTLANAERYVTPELKEREAEVLGAEERAQRLEAHLFEELINELDDALAGLSVCARSVAVIDALAGFAEVAHRKSYCRPELHLGRELSIQDGRHPVVENSSATPFVANDCRLGGETSLMVITGPNMAGKSTYLRQVALLTLMAHCGCYVPAASARVPLVDRIFTRIGASDDLGGGRSTFMVEMTETAAILDNMTDRSLVVLDEIGRGTSTFDGISIAWAVAEAMVRKGVKTLFATHYHELAALAGEHDAVVNHSVAVRRHKGKVVFLYRIVAGAASGSYGIEVGRLAGLPVEVTDRAREILDGFETGEGPLAGLQNGQLGLFTQAPAVAVTDENDELLRELSDLDTDTISPLEALKILAGLVRGYRNRE